MSEKLIHLTKDEVTHAAHVGADRHISYLSVTMGYNASRDQGWPFHIQGALGELAFALYADVPWEPHVGETGYKDVGDFWEVRATYHKYGRMILHDHDDDDDPFILANLYDLPTVRLMGWCYAKEGKLPQFLETPEHNATIRFGAYFVPVSHLHDMETLPNPPWEITGSR
jgi:hypothetical protein